MRDAPLAVCAIFRDEAPFLAEWIAFHRLVGVEHFFLYDNGSADGPEAVLEPFRAEGCVTLRRWPVPFHEQAARRAYTDCVERARGRVRWLACLDLDEFLFSPQGSDLRTVLRDYEAHPGVVVRWQVYGSSGRETASPEPVIARFPRRARRDWVRNRRVKSIVDPERALRAVSPHHFVYRDGALPVDETGRPVALRRKRRLGRRLRRLYALLGPVLLHVDPYAATDVTSRTVSVERLRINHYPVRSREEFLRKARLKKAKARYRGIDYFRYHDRNEVFDPVLWRYLPELEASLGRAGDPRYARAQSQSSARFG